MLEVTGANREDPDRPALCTSSLGELFETGSVSSTGSRPNVNVSVLAGRLKPRCYE